MYKFEKKAKTCIAYNETLGGMTLGLVYSNFLPQVTTVPDRDNSYLLSRNLPSLNIVTEITSDMLQQETDLFACNINQIGNKNIKQEIDEVNDLLLQTNYKNYFIVINANPITPNMELLPEYRKLADILSDKNYFTVTNRMFYRQYGGSEFRGNYFITGTQYPVTNVNLKLNSVNLSSPALGNYLAALKDRNGYPKDWELDVLNDPESFYSQIKKLERCVLPSLVKIVAERILVI